MKLTIFSIIGVLTFISLTESRQVHNYAQVNCYIKRLKAAGKLESDYPEFNVENQIENCEPFIKEIQKEAYKKAALNVRRKTSFGQYTKCIMNDLRSSNWLDDIMKQAVYLASNTFTDAEKTVKVEEIETDIKKTATDAMKTCVYQKEFGELFDDFFIKDKSSSSEEEDDPIADYCGRKYVVDNNLVDTAVYNIVVNPKNLDVSNVNCDEVNKETFKKFSDLMEKTLKEDDDDDDMAFNATQVQCMMEKYRQGKFTDKMIVISAISEVDITEQQKASERKSFIKFMADTTSTIVECS